MNDPTLLTCGICGEKSLRVHNFVACIDALKASRDAAEERGRRRGVEERDELRALLRAVRHYIPPIKIGDSMRDRIDAALAPRASALGCICQGGKTQPYCAYCLGMSALAAELREHMPSIDHRKGTK